MQTPNKILSMVRSWSKFATDQQAKAKPFGSKQWNYYLGMEIGMNCLEDELAELFYPVIDVGIFFLRVELVQRIDERMKQI